MNVARTVSKLGGSVRALVAVGGAMGDRLLQLLTAEDVPALPVAVSGETRQSFAVTDDSTGGQFRFSVPGQPLTAADTDHLLTSIAEQTLQDGLVVISGSVAPGLSDDFLGRIIAVLAHKNARVVIDTSGRTLDWLIGHPAMPVDVLRIDQTEAAEAATHPMTTAACRGYHGENR